MRMTCFAGNYIIIIAYASVVSSFNTGSLQDYVQPAVEERSSGKATLKYFGVSHILSNAVGIMILNRPLFIDEGPKYHFNLRDILHWNESYHRA